MDHRKWSPETVDDSRFRQLVDSIEDYAIFILNADGVICSWNLGASRIKGYAKEEILGKHFSIFYTQEAILANLPALELKMAAEKRRYECEGTRRRKDGSLFWANIVFTAFFSPEGGVEGFAKITRDITERKRLEDRFRRVVESAPSAMVMINTEGQIEMVNNQAERMFGYVRGELLGKPVEVLIPGQFQHNHPALRKAFLADPRSRPMGAGRDLYACRKDGSEFPVEIGLNPLDTSEGLMILSSIVDISDRKQKEARIEAALREKDLLLGEIHHRVKNNLHIIQSLLELQASQISDPEVRSMLMDSQSRIASMALIHQRLYQSKDFSKVDFGEFLNLLVPSLLSSYGENDSDIDLDVRASAIFLPIDQAIPCGLIVNELVTNTIKHAYPRGSCGQLQVALKPTTDRQVMLMVSDEGVGIPDDLNIEETESLGLRLVTLLAEQIAGTMTIHRHHPTRFTLTFPAFEDHS